MRPALEEQVGALGLAQTVIFTGWQENMPAIYSDLDLLVLTSLNEGTPVTVIEALATGVPVVASEVGGVPDVMTHQETGLLVPSGDAEATAQGILQFLRAPERAQRLALAGQRVVLGRFDLRRLVNDMDALYHALLIEKGVNL